MAVGGAGWPARRPALVALLALAMAMASCGPFLLGVLAPFIVDDLHLSKASLGLLATGMVAVAALASPLAGSLVDRFGGRPMLLCIFAVTTAGTAGMALAGSYAWLLPVAAVAGTAAALANPVTNQLVVQLVPRGAQGGAMGVKQSGVQVGTFAAGLLLPPAAVALGWRPALALSAVPALLGLAATFWVVPVATAPGGETAAAGGRPGRAARRSPLVAKLTVYGFLMGVGTAAMGAYLVLYGVEVLGLSAGVGGLAIALLGLAGIISRIGWARRSERLGTTGPLLVLMSLGGATSVALVWAAQTAGSWLLWPGALGFGTFGVAWNAVANLALVRELPAGTSGRSAGTLQVGFYSGFALGPLSFGWVVDRTGSYGPAWLLLAAVLVAAGAVLAGWDAAASTRRRA